MTMSAVELRTPLAFPEQEEELTKQQQLQVDALRTVDPLVVSDAEFHLAAQLAHCASQHHASEYNIVKFGPHGSPTTYVPLSIQLPSYIKELQRRQSVFADQDPWWLAHPSSPPSHSRLRSPHMNPKRLSTTPHEDTEVEMVIEESITSSVQSPKGGMLELVEEANSSPNQLSNQLQAGRPQLKTSRTHPINISPIIPYELLPIISSHLQPSDIHVPTVFNLPRSMRLDTLTMPPTRSCLPLPIEEAKMPYTLTQNGRVYNQQNPRFLDRAPPAPQVIWNPTSPTSTMEAIESPLVPRPWTSPISTQPRRPQKRYLESQAPSPMQIDPPPQPYLTPLPIPLLPVSSHSHTPPPTPPPPVLPAPNTASKANASSVPDVTAKPLQGTAQPRTNLRSNPTSPRRFPPPILGNIMLSSCPGKKVRLKGPVRGRGAICRDLGTDLERIAGMGVRCIVCCLDDEELEFLGVNWVDYSRLARQNGIDILRVPMPEGLAPHAIAPFNYALDVLIQKYTLQGIPVLVHCRGGVGRAGLVACCWMMKVGLCGWFQDTTPPTVKSSSPSPNSLNDGLMNGGTLPIVPSQAHPATNGHGSNGMLSISNGSSSNPFLTPETSATFSPSPSPSTGQSQTFSIINGSSLSTPNNGSLSSFIPIASLSPSTPPLGNPTSTKVSPEILDLVQKVIAVVRRRRSVKAIETYEQVKFLVEFADFLRNGTLKNYASAS